ncbi:MAG: response regulator [Myxococcaceae bacterium]
MATPSASEFPAAASTLASSRIIARIASRVLVVEPKPRARNVLKVALSRAGFEVVAVGSAEEAAPFLHLDRKSPSVVVIRAGLRGTDGRRFRSELLLSKSLARVPVILLTRGGHLPGEDLVCMGVDDYLFKPFTARDVVALVRLKCGASSQDRTFSSTTAELPIAQLLRALLSGMSSGRIVTEQGAAEVAFRRGAVVRATFAGNPGRAVLRTLLLARGPYHLEAGPDGGEPGPLALGLRELSHSVWPVVRRWRDVTARAASLEARWQVDYLRLAETAPGLPTRLHQMLQLFDGARTVRDVLIASSVDELADFISLNQLHQSGVLRGAQSQTSPSMRKRIIEPLEWPVSHPAPRPLRIATPIEIRSATFPVSERQPEKLHLEVAASAALDDLDDEEPSMWQWPEGLVLKNPAAEKKIQFTPLDLDEDTDEYWVDPALELDAAPEPSAEALRDVLSTERSANEGTPRSVFADDPFLAWAERASEAAILSRDNDRAEFLSQDNASGVEVDPISDDYILSSEPAPALDLESTSAPAASVPVSLTSTLGSGDNQPLPLAASEEPQGLDLKDSEIAEAASLLSSSSAQDSGLSTETKSEPNPAEIALETAVASLSSAMKFLTEMLNAPDEEQIVHELSDEDILPDDVPVGPPPLPKAEPRATATGGIASVRPQGESSAVATLPATLEQERTATQFPDAAESTASAAPFPSTALPGDEAIAVESMTTPSIDVARRNRTATLRPTSTRPSSSAEAIPSLQRVLALAAPVPTPTPRPPPPPADALLDDRAPITAANRGEHDPALADHNDIAVARTDANHGGQQPYAPRPASRSEINPETSGVFARWLGEEDEWGGSNAKLWAPQPLDESLSGVHQGLAPDVIRQLNAFRIQTLVEEESPEEIQPALEFPRPRSPIVPATSLDLRERAELHRLLRTRARTRLAFTTQDRTPIRYPLAAATALLGLAVLAFTAAAGIWPWSQKQAGKDEKPSVTRSANGDLDIELEEVNIQPSDEGEE